MQYITSNSVTDNYTSKIYINEISLNKQTCNEIINLFESENNRSPGRIFAGVNPNIKDTMDYTIDFTSSKWEQVNSMLKDELMYNLQIYIDRLNAENDYKASNNNTSAPDFKLFDLKSLVYDVFMVQKYTNNKGRYTYHNDFRVNPDSSYRVITYLWYLNDVEIGGETVFEGTYAIRPQTGKLILFPASWTYPHCGKMPVSSDKYIITGWITISK
jgi:hypothetical protein